MHRYRFLEAETEQKQRQPVHLRRGNLRNHKS